MKERGWLRDGKNGSMWKLVVDRSMSGCKEDLTVGKIHSITMMLLNCLVEDEVMDESNLIPLTSKPYNFLSVG